MTSTMLRLHRAHLIETQVPVDQALAVAGVPDTRQDLIEYYRALQRGSVERPVWVQNVLRETAREDMQAFIDELWKKSGAAFPNEPKTANEELFEQAAKTLTDLFVAKERTETALANAVSALCSVRKNYEEDLPIWKDVSKCITEGNAVLDFHK